jgi:hypothetical protein
MYDADLYIAFLEHVHIRTNSTSEVQEKFYNYQVSSLPVPIDPTFPHVKAPDLVKLLGARTISWSGPVLYLLVAANPPNGTPIPAWFSPHF